MDGRVEVRGIVLSERPVGEYDKLVTILTLERGKIRAFGRGAKRPRNRLAAALQPFHFGNFRLYEGRDSYNIEDAEILNYFEQVRGDLDNSLMGMLFLELADYYGRENNDDRALLALLYQALRALEKGKQDRSLIRVIYEIRALAIDGQYPGIPEGDWHPSTRYACQFIVQTPVEHLFSFTVSDEVMAELNVITGRFRRQFIDRELKTAALLP